MGVVHVPLNVSDLDEAIGFYSKLFETEPAKRRPGDANFVVVDPPLKLVLFENAAQAGSLNHLGVEVGSTDDVVAATRRLAAGGLPAEGEDGAAGCHALQDKVWVAGADTRWEVYTVLADAPDAPTDAGTGGCCATAADSAAPC